MTQHKIIIVGSGFSGICIGIKLKQAGIDDFIILEKAAELGGTWRENTYPGVECDIPSALYSFSFEPNPHWKHVWSKRNQIFQYQKDVAEKHNLMPHFRFNQPVSQAEFKQDTWLIQSQTTVYQAQHFISAIGQLHEPFTPTIEGSEHFKGAQFHAAAWNHDIDLNGKRVAVIGAAASAVQLIPEVAKQAKHLTVMQRTPNWMMEKSNRVYSRFEHWAIGKFPALSKLYRGMICSLADGVLYPAVNGNKLAAWFVKMRVHHNLNKHIKDPILKAKLTPNYTIGAKRILFSHKFYETLNLPHVELQTSGIAKLTESGIKTEDGQHIEADVIVYATGFITNPFLKSINVIGRTQTLSQAWQNGAHAYLGIHTHGFPNLHMMFGPNTNLAHSSIILMIEAQADFIATNIVELDKQNVRLLEVSSEAEAQYNQEIQARLAKMAFSDVKNSWYIDNGKITNNWAGSTKEYKKRLNAVDIGTFNLN